MNFIKKIISPMNPEIKQVAELHRSKGRQEQQRFIAEGLRTCSMFVQNNVEPIVVYVTEDNLSDLPEFLTAAQVTVVTANVMQKISAADSPSGILAIFPMPAPQTITFESGAIILDHISDPGNMGTLFRSAVAMGYKQVIVIGGCDIWNPKVVQASAGTMALLNIVRMDLETALTYKDKNPWYALVVDGGKNPTSMAFNGVLCLGSEAHGLSEEVQAACDHKITLTMPGEAESLNVAVAGSIAMYIARNPQAYI